MKTLIITILKRTSLFLFIILIFSTKGYSQKTRYTDKQNIDFANYLIKKEYYSDVIYLLKNLNITDSLKDIKNYYLGLSLYNKKRLLESANYFSKVSLDSKHYQKSHFFASYNLLYEKNEKKAAEILDKISVEEKYKELKAFEKSGIALLNRNLEEYSELKKEFTYSKYYLLKEEQKFDEFYTEIKNFKQKSPALAGILSAIIPGSGKMYAKKYGGGLSALLTTGIFGLLTYENYKKAGISNFKTLIFGSLFSVFYIGNIYGSVYAVKDYRNDFKQKMEYRILFNMHIPLRNAFK